MQRAASIGLSLCLSTAMLAGGCGGDDAGGSGGTDSEGSSSDGAGESTTGDPPPYYDTEDPNIDRTSSGGTTTAADDSSAGEDSSTGDTPPPDGPAPAALPTADGTCPAFTEGTLDFAPGETGPRQAKIWVDPTSDGGGPVVFYWHGTGSSTDEALYGLGPEAIAEITALGGMVVAPVRDPAAGQFPWYLVTGQAEDDLHLMDEIVGCIDAGPGLDSRRIHSIGMSAGGLQTSQVSLRRASYIASVVAYSGGTYGLPVPSDAPEQAFAALIYHGGPSDVVGVEFQDTSENYKGLVDARGGYSLICDHGGGHVIPDTRLESWSFMQAHPFGEDPSPYEAELPGWVPQWCMR